jgi:formylglycine-generating enzyme required for sulfatase activity
MADVFISYSKTRAVEAEELASELGDLGYDVWWDTSLLPTGSFGAEIDRQLDAAKAVIVVWSPESVRSKWVRSEAAHGDRQEKLVNTHTTELDPSRQIPKPFDQIHSVAIHNIRAIVGALDALQVARSGGRPMPASGAQPTSVADADDRLFAEVQKADTAQAYAYYLDELPEGRHALVARFRLKALGPAPAAPQPGSSAGRQREGRIKVEGKIVHGAADGWFKAGAGKSEWFKDVDIGPEMVVVPAGSFTMGSPETEPERESWRAGTESPQRTVTIARPFAVGRHAVTRGQFAAFVNKTAHKMEGGAYVWTGSKWEHDPKASWRAPGFAQDDGHPVVCVNWNDAKAYAAWLSNEAGQDYRLATEAEWEYCCRAGRTTPFWWGSSINPTQANYNGNYVYKGGGNKGEYRQRTVPVDSFEANPWGLYQVHGNVMEWCEDVWHDTYKGAPTDGTGWLEGGDQSLRVLRGGSWYYYPFILRSACRGRYPSVVRYSGIGFRLSRTL